jgi:hypothetical protein
MPVYPSTYVLNHFTPDDLLRELVFFNTFEELNSPIAGPMEDSGVVKLYEPSPTPCLYVAPVENMVGRVPLMPLFLAGNATATMPHLYSKRKESGFPLGCADAAAVDGRRGSNVYEPSMRSTRGCGNLGVASRAWVTCQLRILQTVQRGSKLTGMKATSVQLRLVGGERRIKPDSK